MSAFDNTIKITLINNNLFEIGVIVKLNFLKVKSLISSMENSGNQQMKVGSLEDEAKKRKERLANLKKTLENKDESKNQEVCVVKTLPKYVKLL